MSNPANEPNDQNDLRLLRRQARLNGLRLQIAQQNEALAALRRPRGRDSLEGFYDDQANYFDIRDYLVETPRAFAGGIPTTRNDRDEGRDFPIFRTEQELAVIRGAARWLTSTNPIAVGVLTTLTNYAIGPGFHYAATPRADSSIVGGGQLAAIANRVIDEFLDENDWLGDLDRELFQRSRVDGEYFLGLWHVGNGHVQARAIEPDQVTEPSNKAGIDEWLGCVAASPAGGWTFGVHTDPVDAQAIHGYYVQWTNRDTEWDYFPGGNEPILPPDGAGLWMEHAKLNVVRSVKRGLSDFFAIQGNLDLARRVLRNMGEGSAVQAAIAWIQETAPGVTQAQTSSATLSRADARCTTLSSQGSRAHTAQQYDPATILKVPNGQKYLPGPLGSQHAPNFITAAEALLRTVAVRWSLPENLVTGTAENNNFASSLVAENPFVKFAESQQQFYARRDRRTLKRVLWFAWSAGRFGDIPWSVIERTIEITVTPPQIEVRDPEKETQVRQMLHNAGILSRKTWSAQEGFDFEQEQKNLAAEAAADAKSDDKNGVVPATSSHISSAESFEAFDPTKHPRGGNPQNRGEFSKAPGGMTVSDPSASPNANALAKFQTVAQTTVKQRESPSSATKQAAGGQTAAPRVGGGSQMGDSKTSTSQDAGAVKQQTTNEVPAETKQSSDNRKLKREDLFVYFKLLYGERGQRLLKAFERAGGITKIEDVWFGKSDFDNTDAFGPQQIQVDDALNPAEAAQELMDRLLDAAGTTEVRQRLGHFGFKNVEELIESYRQSFKQATEAVAFASELYLSGISIVNEGADWIVTIHDLSEGNLYAAAGFLPMIPASAGKVILKHGKDALQVPIEAMRKITAMPIEKIIELLESTRKLARNMEKTGIARPANAAAHHIVPRTLSKFKEAVEARAILAKFGIGVENAANGVYLPAKLNDAINTVYHGSVHTERYYNEIVKRLRSARTKEDALAVLDNIRRELLVGTFPH